MPTGHVSADYFGVFAELIRARLGAADQDPPFVGMLSNGTSGDVNGVDLRAQTPGARGYERMHEVADALAAAAAEIIGKAGHRDDLGLAAQLVELPLAVRKPDATQLDWARSVLASPEAKAAKPSRPVIYARETLGLADYPERVPIALQAFRIGGLTIVAAPCEVFAETGLAVKSGSPEATFLIELANGYGGYLPPPEQHALGGYETWPARSSFLEIEAEPKIRAGLLDLVRALNAGP